MLFTTKYKQITGTWQTCALQRILSYNRYLWNVARNHVRAFNLYFNLHISCKFMYYNLIGQLMTRYLQSESTASN